MPSDVRLLVPTCIAMGQGGRCVTRLVPATAWTRRPGLILLAVLSVLLPAEAGADLVTFRSGRTMSVLGHTIDGTDVTLRLRGGGEIVCQRAIIRAIEPDEVPAHRSAPAAPVAGWTSSAEGSSRPYAGLVDTISARAGVDSRVVDAVIAVESAGRATAVSPKGAMGLMQLMPATAREYAVDDPFDPRANIEAGVARLRRLLDRYDLPLALAAYNAGEGAVERYGGIPPYRETRDYVRRVLTRLERETQ